MNVITIEMPYIGKELSVNHYKYGYYTKRGVKNWMEELGWLVKIHHIERSWSLPLRVKCSGIFKDKRSQPDLSNLSKVILDAIEEVTGINDRDMRWQDGRVFLRKDANPILVIEISEEGE